MKWAAVAATCLLLWGAWVVPPSSGTHEPPTITAAACCKICSKGKACGNSCIARNKTCHKGPGCACDAGY